MQPIYRIALTLLALMLGGAIIYGLAYAGEQTKGPIEDTFSAAGEIVRNIEEKVIIEQRTETRTENLSWLKRNPDALRNPSRILLGAYDEKVNRSLKSVFDLEKALGATFPLVQIYTAWGSKPEHEFPDIQVESILKSGSIPVITWEPWLTDFDPREFPEGLRPVETRDKNGLNDIASGLYDAYLRQWARAAAAAEQPIFLRLGHEMNDPYRYPWGPQNNETAAFVAAWKHVHDVFRQEKADNVVWVWSPHPAYGWFMEYYPGDDYVDWVSVGALNYGSVAAWSQWWSFEEIFGKHYTDLAAFNKPIMISEFGSLAVGGNRKQWYSTALTDLPVKYPQVKGLLFFHYSNDQTTTQQPLDWTIRYDEAVMQAVKKAIGNW